MRSICFLFFTCLLLSQIAYSQSIPTPKEHFGFNIGDDYQLANYTQSEAYFKKLAASDRTKLVDMGLTSEDRHQWMLIVSSPENIKNLDKYKRISQQLAHADSLTDDQARALAAEGKAIVWIDGGLHATEVVGSHQLIETMWNFVTRKDPETLRILDNCIILFVHANPDGQELVANWYMREPDPKKRSAQPQSPRLYNKYVGHDDNRDFYMANIRESQNLNRQMYIEWLPQIMYNHHQAGPAGSVVAGPPYRDPFNYVFDPLMITSIDAVGAAMINRLNVENKPGLTRLTGSTFSTWYNGGLRTTAQFHNMVGLLTEIIGSPTPSQIPLVPERLIPNGATPFPVTPQAWHFRQSIDYSVSLNYSVLDYATRYRDELLFNIYRMGKNSIDRGNKDNWTLSPKRIEAINTAYRESQAAATPAAGGRGGAGGGGRGGGGTAPAAGAAGGFGGRGAGIPMKYYDTVLKNPVLRDPRGYIIPADQADFPTAITFINALIKTGIKIHRATAAFTVQGKQYPADSYVVMGNQAFRPHVLDMFEPQDHPNDFRYPGGPPIPPYDAAGWTLAYEMGVKFDRILEGFTGPFQLIPYGQLQTPPQKAVPSGSGWVISSKENNSFIAVNDLLKAGAEVYRMTAPGTGGSGMGSFFVPSSAKAKAVLDKSGELGLDIVSASRPASATVKVSPMRIALWDNYGGSIPSGWVRWLMEQYHFPISLVYPQGIDAGDLKSKYDVIIFVTRAIPNVGGGGFGGGEGPGGDIPQGFGAPREEDLPAEYKGQTGRLTADKSIPQLKAFMEAGGSVVTIGSSTALAYHLGLPVRNALVEMVNGQERALPAEKYYIPGSVLRVSVDSTLPCAWGMPAETDVCFDASPVFKITPDAIAKGVIRPIAWFSTNKPLRSGWAWGQSYLQDGVAAFVASVGSGKLYAFGPEITFRGQSHGTFKFLFNQLYTQPGADKGMSGTKLAE